MWDVRGVILGIGFTGSTLISHFPPLTSHFHANNNLSNLRWMTAEENLSCAIAQEDWGQHCYNYSRKGGAIKITFEDGHAEIYPNLMRAVEATGMCKRTLNRYLENPNGFPGQRKKIKAEIISN